MTSVSLEALREKMKQTDRKIVDLLNERARISIAIGKIKEKENIDVYDASQEAKIFHYLKQINCEGILPEKYLLRIFREIISASRSLQKPVTVAFLGPEASFSHLAALSHFGSSTDFIPQRSISGVFHEVEKGNVRWGVVPVENSLEGSLNITLDHLLTTSLKIQAEIFLKVSHCLLSRTKQMEEIVSVCSHPQALAQCRGWLRFHLPHASCVEVESTAAAARIAKDNERCAAIGSRLAATTYGLNIIAEDIEDNPSNTTRFLVIGEGMSRKTGQDKTSILFGTAHAPGALYNALRPFAERQINLTKIESHPVKEKLWEYLFFVDFEGHIEDEEIKECMEDLGSITTFLKILGSYPRGERIV